MYATCKLLRTVNPAIQISYTEAEQPAANAKQCDLEDGRKKATQMGRLRSKLESLFVIYYTRLDANPFDFAVYS